MMGKRFARYLVAVAVGLGASMLFSAVPGSQVSAASYTVTSLADTTAAGTLRWAITQANANSGADTIAFQSGLTGTITLTSDWPNIVDDVTITGPGASAITVSGNDLYRPFYIPSSSAGTQLTILNLTFTNAPARANGWDPIGGIIQNEGGIVSATGVVFKNSTGKTVNGNYVYNYAVQNWGGGVATYTNCRFENLEVGISGDHGTTPNTTSNNEADYTNRTYVVNSTFANNTWAIWQERFTKITGSTFTNNGEAATIRGLNRTTIQDSTFSGNTVAVQFFNWTPVNWTVAANNRFVHSNTFTNNQTALSLDDSWDSDQRSQRWSTITSNTWDGYGTWISASRWNGSANVTDTVTTLNSAGREWTESGNVIGTGATTTTTTSTTSTTVAPATTTTTPSNATTTTVGATSTTTAAAVTQSITAPTTTSATRRATTSSDSGGATQTAAALPAVSDSVATTTTLATAAIDSEPVAPETAPGGAAMTIGSESVETAVSRLDNAINVNGGGLSVTVYGVNADGERVALDSAGTLRLNADERVVIEGEGFEPSAQIAVWLFSEPTELGSLQVSADGKFEQSFNVPSSIEDGDHRLVLSAAHQDREPAVISIGIALGELKNDFVVNRWLIITPLTLAILAALVIPTRVRRRREAAA